MYDKFKLGVGQAHEIEMAMNRVGGWDESLVKSLCRGKNLSLVRDVLKGWSEIKPIKFIIDLNADPFVPKDGWTFVEHKRDEPFEYDSSKIGLYFPKTDGDHCMGAAVEGKIFLKELKNQLVFNANILDFFLAHQELIPNDWEDFNVHFTGTVYLCPDGLHYIRYLGKSGGVWHALWTPHKKHWWSSFEVVAVYK